MFIISLRMKICIRRFPEKMVLLLYIRSPRLENIAIKCSANGGCINYISKGFHSLVLMAFVNSNDKFLYVNIGAEGCGSSGGAFCDTSLFKAIKNDRS